MAVEIEKTFLAAAVPAWIEGLEPVTMVDTYIPAVGVAQPKLRLRRKGNSFEATKKVLLDVGDASRQEEFTIPLSPKEFEALAQCSTRSVEKQRYSRTHATAAGEVVEEVDVFTGALDGLILVDFEFTDVEAFNSFAQPDYCGADVTQEDFIAGGFLAGSSLADITPDLERLSYKFPR